MYFSKLIDEQSKKRFRFEKSKWPAVELFLSNVREVNEVFKWIEDNVDASEKHVIAHSEVVQSRPEIRLRIKFRHEKDLMWFKLRWSCQSLS
jgi:hypothetical protein